MATPKAWNRQEEESLGGASESLGGGAAPAASERFVVLSGAPSGDPMSDRGEEEGAVPTSDTPPGSFSVSRGDLTNEGLSQAISDIGVAAQALGGVVGAHGGRGEGGGRGSAPSPGGPPGAGGGIGGSDAGPPGTGGTPGESAGDSSTGEGMKRGGLVPNRHPGSGDDERIVVEAGEFVITKAATKQYGVALLSALNRGQLRVHDHGKYLALHRDKPAPKNVMGKARPQHTLMRGA